MIGGRRTKKNTSGSNTNYRGEKMLAHYMYASVCHMTVM